MTNRKVDTMQSQAAQPAEARMPVVFVINLARDTARWKTISTVLERQGFDVMRISAIDARRRRQWILSRVGQNRYSTAMNRHLTPGECACALSHIVALRRIVRLGLSSAIIMEDDAAMDVRFPQFVQEDLPGYLSKCAVVKIEGIDGADRKGLILERRAKSSLVLPFVPTQGSAAYAVTQNGASHLVKKFSSFSDPLDFMLSFYEWHGCTYGEVRPMLIHQDNVMENQVSNIQQERAVAYSGVTLRRNRVSTAAEFVIHDVGRRLWRIMVMGYYALRFRTFFVSIR